MRPQQTEARKERSLRETGAARLLARLAVAQPRLALPLFAVLGRYGRGPLSTAPSLEELKELLPELPTARLEGVRPAIAEQERRNQVLFLLVAERTMEALAPLVSVVDAGGLARVRSGPSLLALWHVGVPLVDVPAIKQLGVRAVVPEPSNPHRPSPNVRHYNIHGDATGRLAFLKHSLAHLQKGAGPVLFYVDGRMGNAYGRVAFLGRQVRVGRGIASLARMSGAPIVPVTTRWSGAARAEVLFHDALPPVPVPKRHREAHEQAVLDAIARWFEEWVRAHPEYLRVRFLRAWLEEPKAGEEDTSTPDPSS